MSLHHPMTETVLLLSLLALVLTKVADFVTTMKHVGPEAETNPLARRCFSRLGFKGGLWAVASLWLVIVAISFGCAWLAGDSLTRWLTALTGFGIAWAQWDAARFNRTGKTSGLTRVMLRIYNVWRQRWR